jgi:hypothetical protein
MPIRRSGEFEKVEIDAYNGRRIEALACLSALRVK